MLVPWGWTGRRGGRGGGGIKQEMRQKGPGVRHAVLLLAEVDFSGSCDTLHASVLSKSVTRAQPRLYYCMMSDRQLAPRGGKLNLDGCGMGI